MNRKTVSLTLFITLVGLVFLSGCMGAKEEEPKVVEKAEVPTEKAEVPKPKETEKPAEKKTLADLFAKLTRPAGYKVTYRITSEGETLTQTHYVKGKKLRFDYRDPKTNAEMRFIRTESAFYMCSSEPGQPWMCFSAEIEEPQWQSKIGEVEEAKESVFFDGIQRIAGLDAYCYRYEYGGETSRICYHPNVLLPLLMESEGFRIVAISVDLTPPADSAFLPPAQPMTMEEMIRKYQQGG
ncbi:MAG: hypothetical protein ACE5K4_00130 [Candidatus Hydrothermarchaeota archaeon]